MQDILGWQEKLKKGGAAKYHEANTKAGKLFARDRIAMLVDQDSFVEDGLFANCLADGLAADGVVTGLGKVEGRPVAVVANDSTVKAGSWGARTVEKILRLQDTAERLLIPVFYLVDSAGARITDQVEMFPGRRGAGAIFYREARLSGRVPQICVLFGPSAAGGAYIPAFNDVLIMVDGNASMYLGSPRMAEAVIGEKVSLEEMGGAKMHCTVSGCGDFLVPDEKTAIATAKKYLSYLPQREGESPELVKAKAPQAGLDLKALIPESPTRAYDMKNVIRAIVDDETFFEIKELYAREVITGFARIDGRAVGIVANQPSVKGGVLFVESSNKAARFIQICSAFGLPLLFLSDVPGYMIGSNIEKQGMIRAGAKMIYAMSNARVAKICLVVRKAFGAGLYAMSGPAYGSDAVLALPTAQIAVMGPEPAINAVYFNKLAEMSPEEKKAFIAEKTAEYQKEVDILRLAGELIVDHVIDFSQARPELAKRFAYYSTRREPMRPHGIVPM
jgi:acetyl-CoA carboxylase carboxyltransferase component